MLKNYHDFLSKYVHIFLKYLFYIKRFFQNGDYNCLWAERGHENRWTQQNRQAKHAGLLILLLLDSPFVVRTLLHFSNKLGNNSLPRGHLLCHCKYLHLIMNEIQLKSCKVYSKKRNVLSLTGLSSTV